MAICALSGSLETRDLMIFSTVPAKVVFGFSLISIPLSNTLRLCGYCGGFSFWFDLSS
jgi:hypothetical protein